MNPSILDKVGITLFSIFLFSQIYKLRVIDLIGVDITIITAAAVIASLILSFSTVWKISGRQIFNIFLVIFLAFFFPAIMTLYTESSSTYTSAKVQGFFSLTLLSAVYPILVVNSYAKLRFFFKALIYTSIISVAIALIPTILEGNTTTVNRQGLSANVILISRAASFAVLLLYMQMNTNDVLIRKQYSVILIFCLLAATIFGASRGPLYAMILVCLLMPVSAQKKASAGKSKVLKFLAISVVVLLLLPTLFNFIPGQSLTKLADTDTSSRTLNWRDASEMIAEYPGGIGFGNYALYTRSTSVFHNISYPHNIILEYTVETGVVGGLLFCILLWTVVVRHYSSRKYFDYYYQSFNVFIYFLMQAMLSADMNGNRLLFAFIAVCLVKSSLSGNSNFNNKRVKNRQRNSYI